MIEYRRYVWPATYNKQEPITLSTMGPFFQQGLLAKSSRGIWARAVAIPHRTPQPYATCTGNEHGVKVIMFWSLVHFMLQCWFFLVPSSSQIINSHDNLLGTELLVEFFDVYHVQGAEQVAIELLRMRLRKLAEAIALSFTILGFWLLLCTNRKFSYSV